MTIKKRTTGIMLTIKAFVPFEKDLMKMHRQIDNISKATEADNIATYIGEECIIHEAKMENTSRLVEICPQINEEPKEAPSTKEEQTAHPEASEEDTEGLGNLSGGRFSGKQKSAEA